MADELRDFRGRITVETDAVLESLARTTGKDRAEILREVAHRWALEQIAFAQSLSKRLEAEGISGTSEGGRGRA